MASNMLLNALSITNGYLIGYAYQIVGILQERN